MECSEHQQAKAESVRPIQKYRIGEKVNVKEGAFKPINVSGHAWITDVQFSKPSFYYSVEMAENGNSWSWANESDIEAIQ